MFEMSPREQFLYDYLTNHGAWCDLMIDFNAIKIRGDIVRIIPTFSYLFHLINNPKANGDFEWKNGLLNQLWKKIQADKGFKMPPDRVEETNA
jgi:hypothetical protein